MPTIKPGEFPIPLDESADLPAIDDLEDESRGGDQSGGTAITGYDKGDMSQVLSRYSGVWRSAENFPSKQPTGPHDVLDLDWDAAPDRLRRAAPARRVAPPARPRPGLSEPAPSPEPFREPKGFVGGAVRTSVPRSRLAPSAAKSSGQAGEVGRVAGERVGRGVPEAVHAKKPKLGLLLGALLFIGLTAGIFYWRHHQKVAELEALREPMTTLAATRAPLYDQLAAFVESGRAVANDYCMDLGDPADDTTFVFAGSALPGFPTESRPTRELARIEAGGEGGDAGESDPSHLSPLVVFVNVRSSRAPRLGPGGQTRSNGAYQGVQLGYVIGDAYLGNADTGLPLCSFRFFASNSAQVQRQGNAERALSDDLLRQTYQAIGAGARGVRSEPGVTNGRYSSTSAPVGF